MGLKDGILEEIFEWVFLNYSLPKNKIKVKDLVSDLSVEIDSKKDIIGLKAVFAGETKSFIFSIKGYHYDKASSLLILEKVASNRVWLNVILEEMGAMKNVEIEIPKGKKKWIKLLSGLL